MICRGSIRDTRFQERRVRRHMTTASIFSSPYTAPLHHPTACPTMHHKATARASEVETAAPSLSPHLRRSDCRCLSRFPFPITEATASEQPAHFGHGLYESGEGGRKERMKEGQMRATVPYDREIQKGKLPFREKLNLFGGRHEWISRPFSE